MTTPPNSGQGPEFDPTLGANEGESNAAKIPFEDALSKILPQHPLVASILAALEIHGQSYRVQHSAPENDLRGVRLYGEPADDTHIDGAAVEQPETGYAIDFRIPYSERRLPERFRFFTVRELGGLDEEPWHRADVTPHEFLPNYERPQPRKRDLRSSSEPSPVIRDDLHDSIIPIPRITEKYASEMLSHIPLENSKLTDQPMLDSQRTNPDKTYQIINPNQIGDENKYPGLYEITPLTYDSTYPDLTGVSKEQYLLPLKEGAERSVRDILGDPLYAKVAGFYSDEELLAVLARIKAKAKADSTFETEEVREPGGRGIAQWTPSPRQLLADIGIITREQQMDLFLADLAAKHGFSKPSRSEATGQTNDMKPEADHFGDIGPVPES